MNDLVERLSKGNHPVQANRPDKSAKALKDRIDLGYVHILFKETGTELGIKLNARYCDYSNADLDNGRGTVHFEGGITLNYEKVRCVADIDLSNMEGTGLLVPVTAEEYDLLMERNAIES
jgi:hypothetical protein